MGRSYAHGRELEDAVDAMQLTRKRGWTHHRGEERWRQSKDRCGGDRYMTQLVANKERKMAKS